jgi:tRNA A-37 threonylcarbamoyl transferase component Bud32
VHSTGFVYGDLKLDNLCLGNGEKKHCLKLIDFGLAKPFIQSEDTSSWNEENHIEQTEMRAYGNKAFMSQDA